MVDGFVDTGGIIEARFVIADLTDDAVDAVVVPEENRLDKESLLRDVIFDVGGAGNRLANGPVPVVDLAVAIGLEATLLLPGSLNETGFPLLRSSIPISNPRQQNAVVLLRFQTFLFLH